MSINDCTLLNGSDTYLINGCQYRYCYSSDGLKGNKYYHFKPLPHQRKRAAIKLSQQQVYQKVEVIVPS